MTSYPMMSNMAHSRHHRNVITSSQPRKRSFIGHMFLSNRSNSSNNDLLSTPIIAADNTTAAAEKSFSLMDNHQINHMNNKTTGTSTSTPTSTSTAPPPPAAAHHASTKLLLRSIAELSTKSSSKWDNFYDSSSNVAVSQARTSSSLPTAVLQQPSAVAAAVSFDHHHAKTLERIPQTPHFQPTRNLLQDSSNGMVKMMQTLFNPNIRNVS